MSKFMQKKFYEIGLCTGIRTDIFLQTYQFFNLLLHFVYNCTMQNVVEMSVDKMHVRKLWDKISMDRMSVDKYLQH